MLAVEIACLLAAGIVLSKVRRVVEAINSLLFYATIPLSLVVSTARLGDVSMFASALLVASAHMLVTMAVAIAFTRLTGVEEGPVLVVLSSLPNSVFIALPLASAMLGDSMYALPHAVAFNLVLVLMLFYLSYSGSGRVRRALILYSAALAFGFALNAAGARSLAGRELETLSNLSSTANMLSFVVVGSSLSNLRKLSRRVARGLAVVAAFRYAVSPILLWASLATLGSGLALGFVKGAWLQSVMPPAVTCLVLVKAAGMDEELAVASVAALTPISVALAIYGVGTMPGTFG